MYKRQIYGGALVELDGKQLTIPQLGPYKEDLDPAVRRACLLYTSTAQAGFSITLVESSVPPSPTSSTTISHCCCAK